MKEKLAWESTLPYLSQSETIQKIVNSIGEIFVDIWDADKMRTENRYNSVYDYLNYKSGGVLEGATLAINGQVGRFKKMFDSPYDFGNAMSLGTFDTVDGAVNPKDPLSKAHLLDIMGLAGAFAAGGGAVAQALRAGRKKKIRYEFGY